MLVGSLTGSSEHSPFNTITLLWLWPTGLMSADVLTEFAMYIMMIYLTDVWTLSTTHAAAIANIWYGSIPVLSIGLAFFVDAFTGDFYALIVSSLSTSVGLGLLSMSTPPVFGQCKDYKKECIGATQHALFYTALPLIALGLAGHLVTLMPFLKLQLQSKMLKENVNENDNGMEAIQGEEIEEGNKIYWPIPSLTVVMIAAAVAGIGLPYIKRWELRFGIPAICFVVATLWFLIGWGRVHTQRSKGEPVNNHPQSFRGNRLQLFKTNPQSERPLQ